MSLHEWGALDEDETDELVDGVLVEAEVPSYVHEFVIAWLVTALRNWGAARGALVAGSGGKFAVDRNTGRMPDLTVYLKEAPGPRLEGLIDVPPSIAVEVVTPTARDERRDRIEKFREYAAFGVQWYWIVDPELRSLEVFELGPRGRYERALALTEGSAEVAGCQGLVIDVSALWAEVDALAARNK